jgi:hypothetical protein
MDAVMARGERFLLAIIGPVVLVVLYLALVIYGYLFEPASDTPDTVRTTLVIVLVVGFLFIAVPVEIGYGVGR